MRYLMAFTEGAVTFLSPCLLVLLPAYFSYFAGWTEQSRNRVLLNAVGFVSGFALALVAVPAARFWMLQGTMVLRFAGGLALVLFGLGYAGAWRVPEGIACRLSILSAAVFGFALASIWAPEVGGLLSASLTIRPEERIQFTGILLLLCFSAGLGVPFMICALLVEHCKAEVSFIKGRSKALGVASGSVLVLFGVLSAAGGTGYILNLLAF